MSRPYAELWWIPVGAGGHVVAHTSRWWEKLDARRHGRLPRPLFHSALEVHVAGTAHVIEMAPAWGSPTRDRGVVATGPVGWAWLGRSRLFTYEVRCWSAGILPDRVYAISSPITLPLTRDDDARALLARVCDVPLRTWGRDPVGCGDMWNSNSLVSWLIETSNIDASAIHPPHHGRAPGWRAGIAAARGPEAG